jgi:plasmid maintenance system antidote protein VapI
MCKELLQEWLDERGRGALTKLSRKSGLSPGHIHDLKSGKTEPTTATAIKLAKATGIRAEVWLGLRDRRKREGAGA